MPTKASGTEDDGRPRTPFSPDVKVIYILYSPLFNISAPEKERGKTKSNPELSENYSKENEF